MDQMLVIIIERIVASDGRQRTGFVYIFKLSTVAGIFSSIISATADL